MRSPTTWVFLHSTFVFLTFLFVLIFRHSLFEVLYITKEWDGHVVQWCQFFRKRCYPLLCVLFQLWNFLTFKNFLMVMSVTMMPVMLTSTPDLLLISVVWLHGLLVVDITHFLLDELNQLLLLVRQNGVICSQDCKIMNQRLPTLNLLGFLRVDVDVVVVS